MRRNTSTKQATKNSLTKNAVRVGLALATLIAFVFAGPVPTDAAARVTISGSGQLTIKGTPGEDEIDIISSDQMTGTLVIVKVDGVETYRESVPGVKKIKIDTGDGRDRLDIAIKKIPGALDVKLGEGNDFMKLRRAPASTGFGPASLKVDTGNGSDQLMFRDSHVAGKTTIKAKSGRLYVSTMISGWGGDVTITKTGSGDFDWTAFDNDVFSGNLTLKGGNGNDEIRFEERTFARKNITIDTKGGKDKLFMGRAEIARNLTVKSGGGDGEYKIDRVEIGKRFTYSGGSGDDQLSFTRNEVGDKTSMKGGANNDAFEITGNVFEKFVTVDGGGGIDRADGIANVFNGGSKAKSIENG